MSVELNALLALIVFQIISLLVTVCGELLFSKNKKVAQKIAERLGLILVGVLESSFLVLLCFLFG